MDERHDSENDAEEVICVAWHRKKDVEHHILYPLFFFWHKPLKGLSISGDCF